ncbi:MAG TPA: hypothetical protein VEU53_07985 [Stellaceae bacterium]|nr:hypothetical protein [Stellaceae bacterium]
MTHYDWQRFWIPQTGVLDLSDAGFLRDPVGDHFGPDVLRLLSDLQGYQALALLGEPGIGKSSELKLEHDRIAALAEEVRPQSMYVDLRVSSSEEALRRRIFEAPVFAAWKAGAGHLILHLDSLDEAMLRVETLASLLAEELQALPSDRLSVRIACRTAVWPAGILGTAFRNIWGETAVRVFELAPLRRLDVLTALAARGIDPDRFILDLFGAHAVPFAIKPLTLDMLIKIHQRYGRLPSSTGDLYRQGCLALAEEQNVSRLETRRRGRLNGPQRLRVAERIAAGTVLGGRVAIWTGADADRPAEDVLVSRLSGAAEQGDFASFVMTDDDVREVLDTGLFSSRGDHRMGWAHQGYGEFLAALYVKDKRVPSRTILQVLTHPTGGLIPQLAVVAAWTASLSAELRVSMINADPWALLRGDLSKWEAPDLELLTRSMLDHVEQGRFFEHFFGMTESYAKLAHPGLAEQLRPVIVSQSLKAATRRVALNIAERCGLRELGPEILKVALDSSGNHAVRAMAVAALRRCGDASAVSQLLVLARGEAGDDPHDEMKGYALDLLWPAHISAKDVFAVLTPSDPSFFGAYVNFMLELPARLSTPDLLPALDWATDYIGRANIVGEFHEKTLADRIMYRAWGVFEEPRLTAAFLAHVDARLHRYGDLCFGTDYKANEAFVENLRTDRHRRRLLLRSWLAGPVDRTIAIRFQLVGFLALADFDWLLSVLPGGDAPIAGLDEDSLCNAVDVLFSRGDGLQFEAIYEAARRWPQLHQHFSWLLDGIALQSAEAARMRSYLEQERQLAAMSQHPPVPQVDLPEQILDCLGRVEAGEWQAWWQLNVVLARSPENPNVLNDLEYVITEMPGWLSAEESVRERIVAGAASYLAMAESQVDSWLGLQPLQLNRVDLAALRAFLLLRQADPTAYGALSNKIWQKWAPVIVGLPRHGVVDKYPDAQAMTRDALSKAPTEFIGTVVKMIRMEKALERSTADHSNSASRFHIVRDLEGCWDNDALKTAIFQELIAPDLASAEYAALLDVLLEVQFEPAIERAVADIGAPDRDALKIATVALTRAPVRAWPALWTRLTQDDELARNILLHAAGQFYTGTPFYAGIGEEAIADLYLLMERLFPSKDDQPEPSGFVSPLQAIPYLRDGALRFLVSMGTEAAVRALRRLVTIHPDLPILPFELSRAEIAMRLKTWLPLTVREVFALTDRPDARLVTSAADLLAILLGILDKFAMEVHGAQTPVRGLWDRQGTSELWRPIDENGFSDVIAIYLRQQLSGAGIFVNREVEVVRHPGAPVGQRTDILINTLRRSETGEPLDPIAAVIEVKGCWNAELFTALKTQLVQDYMVQLRAPVGIYLVGWFDPSKWDPKDGRRNRVPKDTAQNVRRQLEQQAATAPEGFRVRAVAMNIAAP